MIVYSVIIPRGSEVKRHGIGHYTVDPFDAVVNATGRHVNREFVRRTLIALGADTISTESINISYETRLTFEHRGVFKPRYR